MSGLLLWLLAKYQTIEDLKDEISLILIDLRIRAELLTFNESRDQFIAKH